MVDKKIIEDAVEMTKNIPASDILVPLQPEDKDSTPYPKIEYRVIEATTMDKLIRDVNNNLKNGWQTEGGIQVASGNITKFYQSMIRWNVDANIGPKPEMPSENSEASTMGPNAPLGEGFNFLEDEPDLYEDIDKDATNGETNGPVD